MSDDYEMLADFSPPPPFELGHTSKERTTGGDNSILPDPFYNDYEAPFTIKHENHRHRMCIMLALAGATNVEIAAKLGYSTGHVANIMQQTWARARMLNEIKEAGREELRSLLSTAGMQSLKNLVLMANDEKVNVSARLKANETIVDRWLGKSTQPVVAIKGTVSEMTEAEVDEEIKRIKNQRGN